MTKINYVQQNSYNRTTVRYYVIIVSYKRLRTT